MILLFTDFGSADLYVGQVKVAIFTRAPGVMVVDLLNDAPNFDIRSSAHLLAAMTPQFEIGSVCMAVVDPGVGSARGAVVMLADEKWYVGPDNGLLAVVAARASKVELWNITWRPDGLSNSFHGRDLFAPIAAWIEKGAFPHGKLADSVSLQVHIDAADLPEIIYIDHYGNAMTGLRAGALPLSGKLLVSETVLEYAPVFSDVPYGTPFWYENSIGLIEIAVNRGSAALMLGLKVGGRVRERVK